MLTKKKLLKDYNKCKQIAIKLYKKGHYVDSLKLISFNANLMYNFNAIYYDEELEDLIVNISEKILPRFNDYNLNDNTVLFYDYWGLETRGLTNIYLNALLKNGLKVIFVTLKQNSKHIKWISELIGNDNIFYITKFDDYNKSLKELCLIYKTYFPKYVFYHSIPSDTLGAVFLSSLKSDKYLINLTDHAFWIGSKVVDYVLEFREYGYNISEQKRKISANKLMLLPYYPVIAKKAYKMPEEINSIGNYFLSGGSLYKIEGSDIFLNLVKDILIAHENLSYVYIGSGNSSYIKKYFHSFGLANRFFYFSERPDFNEFIKNGLFYLDTFPMNGGLMVQYSVINKTVPLSLNLKQSNVCTTLDLEGILFNYNSKMKLSFNNIENLKKEVNLLLNDNKYREAKQNKLDGLLVSKDEFDMQLKNAIFNKNTTYSCENRDLDLEAFSDNYFEAENNINHRYDMFFATSKNKYIYLSFCKNTFIGGLKWILRKVHYRCRCQKFGEE